MAEPNNTPRVDSKNSNNTPSFLSPVGETSMNYSVAVDDDEELIISALSPTMITSQPPLHNRSYSHDRSRNSHSQSQSQSPSNGPVGRNDQIWGGDNYEANYGIDDDQYVFNVNNDNGDNDLPTPLLGYNYHHDDNEDYDDDRYHHPNRLGQQHSTYHEQQHRHHQNASPKLNGLNYLNVITYVLNVFTSYFIGVRGLFGLMPTRRDIFIEFETLVTPADYAYWLWAPILVFEFIFATAQLLPKFRGRPIIQQGTGLYFFWACIIQTIWTVFFAKRWFIASFVAVVLALVCLVLLLASQHYNVLCAPTARGREGMTIIGFLSTATMAPARRRKSLLEYWFFRFPFYLHCGWLLVCMVVQFSMVFRYRFTDSPGAQLTADIVALAVLLPPATFFLTGQSSGPDFVIPIVIIWSYLSIAVELNQPHDNLVLLYGHAAILAVQNASYVFTGLIGVMLVPRIIVWIAQEFCTIDVVELDDEEEDISATINEVRLGLTSSGGNTNTNTNNNTNTNDGFFQRFSLRRNADADADDERILSGSSLETGDDGDDGEEYLASARRRLANEESVTEEETKEEDEEDQYEDCHETEDEDESHE